jgi:AcrR family transcriptional regulator
MSEKKVDQRIVKTKKKLADALLILSKTQCIDDIKVSDICSTAHISRATFYNNFDCVSDVLSYRLSTLNVAVTKTISQSSKNNGISFPQAYRVFLHNISTFMNVDDDRFKVLNKNISSHSAFGVLSSFLLENITAILTIYSDEIRGVPIPVAAHFMAGSLSGLIYYMILHISEYTSIQIEDYIYKLTFEMFYDAMPKKSLLN